MSARQMARRVRGRSTASVLLEAGGRVLATLAALALLWPAWSALELSIRWRSPIGTVLALVLLGASAGLAHYGWRRGTHE